MSSSMLLGILVLASCNQVYMGHNVVSFSPDCDKAGKPLHVSCKLVNFFSQYVYHNKARNVCLFLGIACHTMTCQKGHNVDLHFHPMEVRFHLVGPNPNPNPNPNHNPIP